MVGDVVGKPGREAVVSLLPRMRSAHRADFTIVNGENAAGGLGITPEIARTILGSARADVITLGNHAFAKREVYGLLAEELRILRPANYPPAAPGRGYGLFQTAAGPIAVAVLQARTFMEATDDPFRAVDAILEEIGGATKTIFLEIHGEATSEKQAFGWYVDGRASAVVGSHTHVQTADERILPGGTAYITDVGMTGPMDSVIGMKRDVVIPRFLTQMPARFEVAGGPAMLNAVAIDIDGESGRALAIERIQIKEIEAPSDRIE
jgi:hypothetical protein